MQRELKFRGWNIEERKMYEGVQDAYDYLGDIPATTFGEMLSDKNWVVMQFTGFKDKNGREVYEEDVVHIPSRKGQAAPKIVADVRWSRSNACWLFSPKGKKRDIRYRANLKTEVIGNTYENPELLKPNE